MLVLQFPIDIKTWFEQQPQVIESNSRFRLPQIVPGKFDLGDDVIFEKLKQNFEMLASFIAGGSQPIMLQNL